jgi:hypothetical protein
MKEAKTGRLTGKKKYRNYAKARMEQELQKAKHRHSHRKAAKNAKFFVDFMKNLAGT